MSSPTRSCDGWPIIQSSEEPPPGGPWDGLSCPSQSSVGHNSGMNHVTYMNSADLFKTGRPLAGWLSAALMHVHCFNCWGCPCCSCSSNGSSIGPRNLLGNGEQEVVIQGGLEECLNVGIHPANPKPHPSPQETTPYWTSEAASSPACSQSFRSKSLYDLLKMSVQRGKFDHHGNDHANGDAGGTGSVGSKAHDMSCFCHDGVSASLVSILLQIAELHKAILRHLLHPFPPFPSLPHPLSQPCVAIISCFLQGAIFHNFRQA